MKKAVGVLTLVAAAAAGGGVIYSKWNKDRLSGTYEACAVLWMISLTFKRASVTASLTGKLTGNTQTSVGTYEYKDGVITFFFPDQAVQDVFGDLPIPLKKKGKTIILNSNIKLKKAKK